MLRALPRIFALLVLVSIGHDLAAACCDPLVLSGTTSVTTQEPGGAADHCKDVCVPDCYCCSVTLAAGERVRFDSPVAVAHRCAIARPIFSAGVVSVPDPVPRATA